MTRDDQDQGGVAAGNERETLEDSAGAERLLMKDMGGSRTPGRRPTARLIGWWPGVTDDAELLVEFLDEARDLLGLVDRYARRWAENPDDRRYPQNLLENLHTLKGGAQLCGFDDVCALVHRIEDLLAGFQRPGRRVGEPVLRELESQRGKLRRILSLEREKTALGLAVHEALDRADMIPFARLLPRLHASVDVFGRMLGKPVQLHGGEVDFELNAGVARQLAMALEEILRDAVCHGIELPGRRRALGKAASGQINLGVSLQGDDLVIEVEDDGQGIDVARVRDLAGSSGLLAEDAALHRGDWAQYVFAPGLSTSGETEPGFGRGMGLSAARTCIARLGGRVAVDSRPGLGARFVVRIAQGLRIERAWVFSIRGDPYAILENAVEARVPVDTGTVEKVAAAGVFEHSSMPWEFHFPGELLGHGRGSRAPSADGAVLLLRRGERRIALYAGAVRGSQEIVTGGAGKRQTNTAGVSLATLLDDGSLVALLDPGALL